MSRGFCTFSARESKHPFRAVPALNAEANLFAPSKRNFITPSYVSTVCPEADVSAGSLALFDFSDGFSGILRVLRVREW